MIITICNNTQVKMVKIIQAFHFYDLTLAWKNLWNWKSRKKDRTTFEFVVMSNNRRKLYVWRICWTELSIELCFELSSLWISLLISKSLIFSTCNTRRVWIHRHPHLQLQKKKNFFLVCFVWSEAIFFPKWIKYHNYANNFITKEISSSTVYHSYDRRANKNEWKIRTPTNTLWKCLWCTWCRT